MNSPTTIKVLNRLYLLYNWSLPIYLRDAGPWSRLQDEPAKQTLAHIIEDHESTSDRLGSMILDRNGIVEIGRFPMEFTGWNDLSFDFILQRLLEWQRRNIRTLERCVGELDGDPAARAVAEELLGEAKGHLESLNDLTTHPVGA